MMILMFLILMTFMISMILIMLNMMISKKTFMDREKNSPFECGFDPKSYPRLPFSMHFFMIAIIFLIFDVEIAIMIPMIFSFKLCNTKMYFLNMMFFILILILGLYHEWNEKTLNWSW